MFFTLSQQVSLEITKALFVSRGTVCASPLSVAATGTAPVPRHIEMMFSTERCPFLRCHQQLGQAVRSFFTYEIRLMTISLPRRLCQLLMTHVQQVEHQPRGCCDQADRLALSSSVTGDDWSPQDVPVYRLTGLRWADQWELTAHDPVSASLQCHYTAAAPCYIGPC